MYENPGWGNWRAHDLLLPTPMLVWQDYRDVARKNIRVKTIIDLSCAKAERIITQPKPSIREKSKYTEVSVRP